MRARRLLVLAIGSLLLCGLTPALAQAAEPAPAQSAMSVAGVVAEPEAGHVRTGARLAGVRAPEARITSVTDVGLGIGKFVLRRACGVVCLGVSLAGRAAKTAGEAVADVAGGVLDHLAIGIADGAAWMMRRTARLIDRTTTPVFTAEWFQESYGQMRRVAVLFAVLAFLAAIISAITARDGAAMLSTVGLRLPLAFGLTAALAVIAQMAVEVADSIAAEFARAFETDTRSVLRSGAHELLRLTSTTGTGVQVPGIIAIVVSLFGIATAFLLWIELLVRDAALLVVVFLAPLACAAMIWQRCVPLLTRTLWTLFALIMSKPLIVALMSLAGNGVAEGIPEQGINVVLPVLVLLLLACLTPWALLALVPLLEGYAGHRAARRAVSRYASAPGSVAEMGGRSAMQAMMNDHFRSRGGGFGASAGASAASGGGSGAGASAAAAGPAAAASGAAAAAQAAWGRAGTSLRATASAVDGSQQDEPSEARNDPGRAGSGPSGTASTPVQPEQPSRSEHGGASNAGPDAERRGGQAGDIGGHRPGAAEAPRDTGARLAPAAAGEAETPTAAPAEPGGQSPPPLGAADATAGARPSGSVPAAPPRDAAEGRPTPHIEPAKEGKDDH